MLNGVSGPIRVSQGEEFRGEVCKCVSERTKEIEKRRDNGGRGSVREGTQKEAAVRGREQELQPRKEKKKNKKGQQTQPTTITGSCEV